MYNRNQRNYWTKENCEKEALKYLTKSEFQKEGRKAYRVAQKNKWLEDICKHMIPLGNRYKRCIYAFEFSDNYVYVGLTYNTTRRKYNHFDLTGKSVVAEHIKEIGINPCFRQLTDYIDVNEASILEGKIKDGYKNNGWIILNKVKCGSIGSSIKKWTKENCLKEALKYKNRSDFSVKSSGAYGAAIKNSWLESICLHMPEGKKKNGTWTNKENCLKEALKYKNRSDFNKKARGAYLSAYENDWLDEICIHMERKIKPNGFWTKERCLEESLKYDKKYIFQKESKGAYKAAYINGWLNEFFK